MSDSKATRRDVVLCTALAVALGLLGTAARAVDGANVKTAMQTLKDETAKMGTAKLDGDALYFGDTKINDGIIVLIGKPGERSGERPFDAVHQAIDVGIEIHNANLLRCGRPQGLELADVI